MSRSIGSSTQEPETFKRINPSERLDQAGVNLLERLEQAGVNPFKRLDHSTT
jgi:hypothetical protein